MPRKKKYSPCELQFPELKNGVTVFKDSPRLADQNCDCVELDVLCPEPNYSGLSSVP